MAVRNNDEFKFPYWKDSEHFNIPEDRFGKISFDNTYNEPNFHYNEIQYRRNINLMGYFQSYKYFQAEKDMIFKMLSPKIVSDPIDRTSIHVRRTDYLEHKGCYEILNMENYYEKAMERSGSSKFLIFSDDIPWCKKHFIGNEFEFSERESDILDLSAMIACSNNIVANSSFSFWGAWLNPSPDKIVIAPRKWFGPKLSPTHDTKDLCPVDWIKI